MRAQKLFINARPFKKSFRPRLCHEREKILIALVILREKHDARTLRINVQIFFMPRARREIRVNAKNRFYSRVDCGFIEFNRAVHIAGVGERKRVHTLLPRFLNQLIYLRQCLQERIVTVRV